MNTLQGPEGGAIFSECSRYRYLLWRIWDGEGFTCGNRLLWVLLNPSTATHEVVDPTVNRCLGYTRDWGYGGIHLMNIFALRSTDPKELYRCTDPVGPENDNVLRDQLRSHDKIIVAWGTHGAHLDRGKRVVGLIREYGVEPLCLKITKDGHPGHPLYLKKDLKPISFEGTA